LINVVFGLIIGGIWLNLTLILPWYFLLHPFHFVRKAEPVSSVLPYIFFYESFLTIVKVVFSDGIPAKIGSFSALS
jgi:hypothetical protein